MQPENDIRVLTKTIENLNKAVERIPSGPTQTVSINASSSVAIFSTIVAAFAICLMSVAVAQNYAMQIEQDKNQMRFSALETAVLINQKDATNP